MDSRQTLFRCTQTMQDQEIEREATKVAAAQNSPTEDGILNEHGYPDDYDPSWWPNTNKGLARRWDNLTPVEKNEWLRDNNYSFRYNEGSGTPDDQR